MTLELQDAIEARAGHNLSSEWWLRHAIPGMYSIICPWFWATREEGAIVPGFALLLGRLVGRPAAMATGRESGANGRTVPETDQEGQFRR